MRSHNNKVPSDFLCVKGGQRSHYLLCSYLCRKLIQRDNYFHSNIETFTQKEVLNSLGKLNCFKKLKIDKQSIKCKVLALRNKYHKNKDNDDKKFAWANFYIEGKKLCESL